MLYDVHNPNRGGRVFYDGLEGSQRKIVLGPDEHLRLDLAPHVAESLKDLLVLPVPDSTRPILETPATPEAQAPKPIFHIIGHRGIGDNIHQRAVIRELMKEYNVYLETPAWMIYHDLIAQGLKLIHMNTNLHAQRKQIQREYGTYKWNTRPQKRDISRRIYYNKPDVDRWGSITHAMFGVLGITPPEKPDFSLPVPDAWRIKAKARIDGWNRQGKPLLLYRPITIRREWNGQKRNPDIVAYHALMNGIRDRFFVVSIADLRPGVEDIVGDKQPCNLEFHRGEIPFDELAGLWAEADLVFANAGFGPVLAQAVGTPCITVYGCRESYRTTERAGAHLAPSLGIDPDVPMDCHSISPRCGIRCKKEITLYPAQVRIEDFISEHVSGINRIAPVEPQKLDTSHQGEREPSVMPVSSETQRGVLIFGTFFVDSPDRERLTEHWIKLHTTLNPDCDFLAVDSQSPIRKFEDWTPYDSQRHKRMYFNFPDNIGHLSRAATTPGKDGWGRAFTHGLWVAQELGYEYAVHIEGDSLFRLNVKIETDRMRRERANCFSNYVHGTRHHMPGWVETGIMLFNVDYLKRSNFIAKYSWPNRRASPTPEIIVRQLVGKDLVIQPHWKVLRADKNQITKDNVESLGLDWVTHQHNSGQQEVYSKFVEMALRAEEKTCPLKADPPVTTVAQAIVPHSELLNINLGCGTNKLPKPWLNHDADVDITKPLPWDDGAAKYIFIEHCVEHVTHKQAIGFFKEAYRVLSPGGVIRVVVPSLEKIRESDDPEYYRFTTKWQNEGPTKRGAMNAIIYAHGHEMIWCGALMEAVLYYCGFDDIKQELPGKSEHTELRGVEGHAKVIGDRFNLIESLVFEARKQPEIIAPVTPTEGRRVAIVVGGGQNWASDLERARAFCAQHGCVPEYFYINDHIADFDDGHCGHAAS